MKEIVFFRKYGIGKIITEGGSSREKGLWDTLCEEFRPNIKSVNSVSVNIIKGFVKGFRVLFKLANFKDVVIILRYPALPIPLTRSYWPFQYAFIFILKMVSKRNKIIIDVEDMPYEQAISLDFPIPNIEMIKWIENKLFNRYNCVFASDGILNIAEKSVGVLKNGNFPMVCVNGANYINKKVCTKEINNIFLTKPIYVYAGTLNKGRSIEELIDLFKITNKSLILMGKGGEWIPKILKNHSNIVFLGPKPEEECREICSQCDIGLIPYNETKDYYNAAYPTKMPFYINSGIPFLSTTVHEVEKVLNIYPDIGFSVPIAAWEGLIMKLESKDIDFMKHKVKEFQNYFTWNWAYKQLVEEIKRTIHNNE